MSIHSELIAGAATPLLMDVAGESLTFNVKGQAAPITVTALIGPERSVEKRDSTERKIVRQRRVTITNDPTGRHGGLAEVLLNATVTYNGVDYSVGEKPAELDGTIAIKLDRTTVRHGGSADYRR